LPFQVTATVPPRPVREETRTPEPVSLGTLGARATRPEIDELLDVMPDQELAYLAVEATRLVKRRLVRGQGRGLRPKAGGRGKSPLDDALRRIGGELMEFEGPWRRVVSRCGVRNSRNTLGRQARPYQPRGRGVVASGRGLKPKTQSNGMVLDDRDRLVPSGLEASSSAWGRRRRRPLNTCRLTPPRSYRKASATLQSADP